MEGLIPAIKDEFPDSENRFCVRHLYQNFAVLYKGEALKNQLWAIARSTTVPEWNVNTEKMKAVNKDAYGYLEEIPPNQWCRAFFRDFSKCDILLNNNLEVFNKCLLFMPFSFHIRYYHHLSKIIQCHVRYILEARELTILSMLEKIRSKLMNRIYTKQEECKKWVFDICPKIKQKVEKNIEMSNTCYALPSRMGIFQLTDRDKQFVVDIKNKQCDCRRWQLIGIPCNHAISCLRHERIKPEDEVSFCYTIQSFKQAYMFNIMPVRDKTHWEKMNGVPVNPPVYEKKVGRPKTTRRKQPQELDAGTKISKHSVQIHCSYCKNVGHNKKGCKKRKAAQNGKNEIENIISKEPTPEVEEVDEPIITQVLEIIILH